ncbi:hypothetical protein L1887_63102 [Cichorium endivia]|nr:hypothetical protein L1887_63102 [Cichorium endivia]
MHYRCATPDLSQIFQTGFCGDRAICCKIEEICPIGWEGWRKSTPHSLQDEIMIDGPPGSSQRPTGQSPPLLPACCAFPALYMRKQLARCEWFRVPRKFTRLAEARPCSESTTSESISKTLLPVEGVPEPRERRADWRLTLTEGSCANRSEPTRIARASRCAVGKQQQSSAVAYNAVTKTHPPAKAKAKAKGKAAPSHTRAGKIEQERIKKKEKKNKQSGLESDDALMHPSLNFSTSRPSRPRSEEGSESATLLHCYNCDTAQLHGLTDLRTVARARVLLLRFIAARSAAGSSLHPRLVAPRCAALRCAVLCCAARERD